MSKVANEWDLADELELNEKQDEDNSEQSENKENVYFIVYKVNIGR